VQQREWFAQWAGKQHIADKALAAAVDEMQRGLIDADLGNI